MWGILLVVIGAAIASAQRIPVVVELFTSEGCSSCPPADQLLADLEHRQPVMGVDILILGQHVDYWDRLGWPDRFSSSQFTERQAQYSHAFRSANIYTPQMVVQGQSEFVGTDEGRVRREVERAARQPQARVRFELKSPSTIGIAVSELPGNKGDIFDVVLAVTESGLVSEVARGENEGRRLSHAGVVRSLTVLASIDTRDPRKGGGYTAEARLSLRPEWKRENSRAVLFVQERHTRRIVGAASLKL
jgi:hypothetical protein